MPMLTTLRMRLPVWPFHAPLRTRFGEVGHPVEHGVHLRARRSRRRRRSTRPRGARSATCSTARFSVTLIFSPRNIASMRARRPDSSASCTSSAQRLVGDAVLRVVEVDARRLRASGARRAPDRRRRARADARRGRSRSAPASAFHAGRVVGRRRRALTSSDGLELGASRRGALRLAPSHRRNPPTKALALSPARQPGGSSFSFLTLPPPSTTSSGSSAALRRSTTSHDVLAATSSCRAARGRAIADVVLVGRLPVRQVPELHRLDDAVDDQRRCRARCRDRGTASCPPL